MYKSATQQALTRITKAGYIKIIPLRAKSIRKNLTIRKPMKPFNIPIFSKILFKLFI